MDVLDLGKVKMEPAVWWGYLMGAVVPGREQPCIKVLMLIQVHVPDA